MINAMTWCTRYWLHNTARSMDKLKNTRAGVSEEVERLYWCAIGAINNAQASGYVKGLWRTRAYTGLEARDAVTTASQGGVSGVVARFCTLPDSDRWIEP